MRQQVSSVFNAYSRGTIEKRVTRPHRAQPAAAEFSRIRAQHDELAGSAHP